jgi:LEA14-like dessication related protein
MRRQLTYGMALTVLCMAAGAVFFMLSGCSSVAKVLNIENPRYSIRDIRPRVDIAIPLSASSIDLDFNVEVDNPNSVGLRLDRIDFDLFINNSRIMDSVSSQNVRIPANGRGDVHLSTRINYQSVRNLWTEIVDVVRGERARYEIRGTAHYDTPLGIMKFPVTVYSSR